MKTWQEDVGDIIGIVKDLHALRRDGKVEKRTYQDDLTRGLKTLALTKGHKAQLIDAASPALTYSLNRNKLRGDWMKSLADSFYDPMIQAIAIINFGLSGNEPHNVVYGLRLMRKTMQQIHDNYGVLLGPGVGPAVDHVIKRQKDLIDRIPDLTERIEWNMCPDQRAALARLGPVDTRNGILHFCERLPDIDWRKAALPRLK